MGLNLISFKTTEAMKAAYLLTAITAEYEKQDIISGAVNIPHFIRAHQKVDAIIAGGELDKEYKAYKRKDKKHG